MSRLMKAFIIPIGSYQAISIAGGYGTGREVVQFFTASGPFGGLYGILISALLLATVAALTFECARLFRTYDYRSFVKELIGPGWIAFEIIYVLLFLMVLAVVSSAASNVMHDQLGIPENLGLFIMLSMIASLLFFGRDVVERSLVLITVLLLSSFFYYFVEVFSVDANAIIERFSHDKNAVNYSGLWPAVQFAIYSSPAAAITLFATSGIETRKEALLSGGLCGLIVMVPAVLFHASFMGKLEGVIQAEVPIYWMIEQLDTALLLPIYLVAMFGTFMGTGLGFIQAVNERLDAWWVARKGSVLPRSTHAGVAIFGLLVSALLSKFGIIALIAQGYTAISWGFLLLFVIPVLTIGGYKIFCSLASSATES